MRRLVLIGRALSPVAPVPPASAQGRSSLYMYTARVSPAKVSQLLDKGYDVTDVAHRRRHVRIDIVLTRQERNRLARSGVRLRLMRTRGGRTVRQVAAAQAQGGFTVFRSWDEPGAVSATSSTRPLRTTRTSPS